MKRSQLGAMLLCILISCSFAFGQSATTSLRGVVKDPTGALVPGATVTILDKTKDKTLSSVSNSSGSYQFAQIPPAHYLISISAAGFGAQSKSAELLVNQPATIDFTLSMQADSVTVDVSASAQTLNTTDATMGDSVGNSTIQALPMEGRNPVGLLTLQPGVLYLGNPEENDTLDSRSGSVNGGRSDQGNITLDGMDDNDQVEGTAFTGVLRSTLDSTEEFKVTTSNGNAVSGRSSGAQVSLVTKSGTNNFHGSLYEYYRPTNTVANNWFNKNQQLSNGNKNRPQKYVQNTFGGAVGGPILKNKLFFFFNYEGLRQAISDVVTIPVPTAQFYQGELGYIANDGSTKYLSSSQFLATDQQNDTNNGQNPCTPSIGCGVNQNVLNYFMPLQQAGIIGTSATAGDGINSAGYSFTSPAPKTLNTSILKLDYSLTAKQQIFVRGNLQKDTQSKDANLPGEPAEFSLKDNTKGIAVGHTWTPTSNIVNDLRYGYIRQGYSHRGIGSGSGDWVNFRFLNQPSGQADWPGGHNLSSIINVPVHNVVDDLTWSKGSHTMSFGANWRGVWDNRNTDTNSYSYASTDPYWMYDFPNTPADLISDGSFSNSYEIAYANLVGTVPQTNKQFNYSVGSGNTGSLSKDGSFLKRNYRANEYEYYVQDAWRIKPNLTVTFGLRHSILDAPYETNGQQVAPTVNTQNWFRERGYAAAKGIASESPLTFKPSGKANHQAGYWAKQKANIAPRLAFVYAPDAKTSIRAGAGMYFDHFGEGIVNSFDEKGAFGLSATVTTPASYFGFENSPRFTGPHDIPALAGGCGNPDKITYPYMPPNNLNCGFAIAWGIDNKLKTPYSYAFDLSFQRELPGGFIFEEAYVGRMGRHLLQELDLAEPTNLNDPKGAGTYFQAAAQIAKYADERGGDRHASVPKIQYFEDVFPFLATNGQSATQVAYTTQFAKYRYGAGETQALLDLDFANANPNPGQFWNQQFSSLYAWSSIGNSSYNALQFTLHHPSSRGLTVDASYTFSKSIDMGSNVERANENSTDAFGGTGGIQNSWNPKANRGVSDFDTRNLVTVDWVYALPVGRGKAVLGGSNRMIDALVGGWQFSGLTRWSSGLPFSVYAPGWATNWNIQGAGVVTGPVKVRKHLGSGSIPQVFDDPGSINTGVSNGGPIRLPYSGEGGSRNYFRGDGYFDIDSSMSKTWNIREIAKLKFAGEVYNVPNNVRFDASPRNLNNSLTSGTLGYYSGVLTTYRRMQFGLRLDF